MRITTLALVLLLALSTASCVKQKKEELRKDIVGTWLKYKVAWDDNNNAQADKKEMHDIPESLSQTTTFSADGTGTIVRNTIRSGVVTTTFTWAVTGAKQIKTTTVINGKNVETEYEVKKLKGNDLTFKTSTPSLKSDVAWEYYRRR